MGNFGFIGSIAIIYLWTRSPIFRTRLIRFRSGIKKYRICENTIRFFLSLFSHWRSPEKKRETIIRKMLNMFCGSSGPSSVGENSAGVGEARRERDVTLRGRRRRSS